MTNENVVGKPNYRDWLSEVNQSYLDSVKKSEKCTEKELEEQARHLKDAQFEYIAIRALLDISDNLVEINKTLKYGIRKQTRK